MQKEAVIDYFGSATNVARALNISKAAVSQWDDEIPELRSLQLEKIIGNSGAQRVSSDRG